MDGPSEEKREEKNQMSLNKEDYKMATLMALPIIGWILGFIFSICISIPFYFLWNWLAPVYFYFLPKIYLDLPFFHCVGIFMLFPLLKTLLSPFRQNITTTKEK